MADIRKRKNDDGSLGYQVRFIDKSNKSGFGYRTFSRAKDATRFKAQQELEEQRPVPRSNICDVHQAIDKWLDICKTQGTSGRDEPVTAYTLSQYEYRAQIMKAYGWTAHIQDLTTPDIVEFKSWLLGNCASRDQARKVLTSFHTVMKEMALRGIIASNIAAGVSITSDSRFRKEIVIPTENEVWRLLEAADALANSKNAQISRPWQRYRAMLYYAADTGMRPQEYLAVPRFNLKDGGSLVDRAIERPGTRISVTKTPAGRRFIPGSTDVLDMVLHYSNQLASPSKHALVFPTSSGHWQSIDNWRKRGFYRACEKADLLIEVEEDGIVAVKPKYTPYILRHYYASAIIDQGLSLKRIQKRMGHANIETTLNTYGHLIERQQAGPEEETGMLSMSRPNRKSCGADVAGEH